MLLSGCFFVLMGCTSVESKKWEKQEITTRDPCFCGSRYIFASQSEPSRIELEMLKTHSGTRFYINFLTFKAPCPKESPHQLEVSVSIEGMDPWLIKADILEGDQCILIPEEVSDSLIQLIQSGKEFDISVCREVIHVSSLDV